MDVPAAAERAEDYRRQLGHDLARGDRAAAVALFMRFAGASENDVASAPRSPQWPGLIDLAHTLAYDATLYGPPPADRLARVRQPTLVVTGETTGFFAAAATTVADLLPDATMRTLDGAGHVASPTVIGPVLSEFFNRRVV